MERPTIPFNDLRIRDPVLGAEIDAAIARVIERGRYVLGPEVEAFEREMADAFGVRFAVGAGSGTDALSLSLLALDIGPGDEVVTSPLTATFTALGISRTGARPVFADVDALTLNLSSKSVETRINEQTKAVVPVHLYGSPCEMKPLLALAERKGLRVIEDACQAHGARLDGRAVGSWGHAGCLSFYPTKNLGALGDGGMVLTDDATVAERVRRLRNGGQVSRYEHQEIGINSRLDEMQAAVLRVKLPRLRGWNHRRRKLARLYDEGLKQAPVHPIGTLPQGESAVHLYVIRAPRREELRRFLLERGVQTLIHYPTPVHLQPAYAGLGQGSGSCPEAEGAATEILSLPLYPEMEEGAVGQVAAAVCTFYDS